MIDYKKMASAILEKVGGKENVSMVTHCATRLRFNLKDEKKADTAGLKTIQGVIGVVAQGGQYQVVIGNDVPNVYREITALGNFSGEGDTGGGVRKKESSIRCLIPFRVSLRRFFPPCPAPV
jgi:PTS system beta-glucosides-specific IIC component